MCCWTHHEQAYPSMALAENEHVRCQCTCTPPCPRRATQEDMKCDVCGGRTDLNPEMQPAPLPTYQRYDSNDRVRYWYANGQRYRLPTRSYP